MKSQASSARLVVCAALLLATPLLAQENAPTATPAAPRLRDREPSWLMDRVEGPNLHYRTFDSRTVVAKVSYLVYLPPGYDKDEARRYPVVYWLHGIGGSQQGVPEMARRMNQAIEEGRMPPIIFVYCNGMIRSGWSDAQWPVETVTIKELIPHIDANYRTIATREGRGGPVRYPVAKGPWAAIDHANISQSSEAASASIRAGRSVELQRAMPSTKVR